MEIPSASDLPLHTTSVRVHPDLTGVEDGDPVAVRSTPPLDVRRGDLYVDVPRRLAVVHVDVVDDDVGDVLQCDASVAHDFLRCCNLNF
jgi:hypothetical protein